jgi:hypothetical protein
MDTIEISITRKNEKGEITEKLQLVAKEEKLSEIAEWEDIVWSLLTFMTFYPKTIDRFLSGEYYDKRVSE